MADEEIKIEENGAEITPCPNCGFDYTDDFEYCPKCGQKNEDSVLSFKEMVLDLLSAFFSFDTKAIRSVPKLLFLPGSLTNEYIGGKRQSYLAPFRLYLFVSIVLFLILPLVITDRALYSPETAENIMNLDSLINEAGQNELDSLKTDIIDEIIPEIVDSAELAGDQKVNWSINKQGDRSAINFGGGEGEAETWNSAVKLVEGGFSAEEAVDSIFSDQPRRIKFFIAQGVKLQSRRGEGLVGVFLDKASYTLFVFLPVFALFLKLLYIRRKRYYIEHLVFSLHFFSFFFFMIILFIMIYKFIYPIPFYVIPLIGLVYLFTAMYKVYSQRWWRTFFKWFTLIFGTCILFIPFFALALIISLLFY